MPRRRAQFLAGRWIARALLAALHGSDPLRDWALTAGDVGPPRLLHAARGGAVVHIAISHSGDRVACAVDDTPVGVDVEVPRPRDVARLAEAVCTHAELAEMRTLDADARERRFYAAWTLKEAWLKQHGDGVSIGRLATLETAPAAARRGAQAWSWRHDGMVVSLAANCEPGRRFGEAVALGSADPWLVRDLVTSP